MAYKKFFNYEESLAVKLDWNNIRVTEKLDGSCIMMYHYNDNWNIATLGSPDAGGKMEFCNDTFHNFFWDLWNELNYELSKDTEFCYIFELISPYNKIIVQYENSNIVLHGARNINNLITNTNMFMCKKLSCLFWSSS